MQTSVDIGRVAKALALVLTGVVGGAVLAAGARMSAHARELNEIIGAHVEDGAAPWTDEVAAWTFHERARHLAEPDAHPG